VRAAWFGITDSLNDRHFPLIIERLERSHSGVKPDILIEGQYLVFGNPDIRPVVEVQRVAIWDDRIQSVVAPGQLEDNQNGVLLVRCHNIPSLRR
jgi:hypothetical protein